jgi:hypothetical protein
LLLQLEDVEVSGGDYIRPLLLLLRWSNGIQHCQLQYRRHAASICLIARHCPSVWFKFAVGGRGGVWQRLHRPLLLHYWTCLHLAFFVWLLLQLEDVEVSGSDYIQPLLLGNFRGAWETLEQATEREDDYGLGPREHLQVGVLFSLTAELSMVCVHLCRFIH